MSPDRAAGGAADGVEHLQRAANELIAAARSFLDAAEELVEDRDLVADTIGAFRGLARDMGAHIDGSARRPFEDDPDGWTDAAYDEPRDEGPGAAQDPTEPERPTEDSSEQVRVDGGTGAYRGTERAETREKGKRSARVRRIDVE